MRQVRITLITKQTILNRVNKQTDNEINYGYTHIGVGGGHY